MSNRLNTRAGHYAVLIVVASVTFLLNLGGASLWDVDEGRNATCAHEMLQAENWIVPTFNGPLRSDKPVLLYWLQMVCYQAFGLHEFSARLPSALAALLTVLLIYELGRFLFNAATGLVSGLVLASTVMLTIAARFANPDALLNCCTTFALAACCWSLLQHRRIPALLFGLGTGLAVLAKGPVGLVLPLAVIGCFLLLTRRLRLLFQPGNLLVAAAVFTMVALPWYILVGVETRGQFLRGFFLTHNVERFLSTMERHGGGPWYYPVVLLVGFTPWSAFIGLVLWYGFWPLFGRVKPRWQQWWLHARETSGTASSPGAGEEFWNERYLFLWCWLLVYLLFFTISATKLPNYVLPVSCPLALLTGRFLERWRLGLIQPPAWGIHVGLGALAVIGLMTAVGLLIAGGQLRLPALAGRELVGLEWLAPLGLIPILACLVGYWCWRKQTGLGLVACLAMTATLFVGPLAAWGGQLLNSYKPARLLVEIAGAAQPENEIRVVCHGMNHLPSLNFYCQRDVAYCLSRHEVGQYLSYAVPVYAFLPVQDWELIRNAAPPGCRVLGAGRDLITGKTFVAVCNR